MKSILDSGNRTQFPSGAVRDMGEGKGRCDLVPMDVVAGLFGENKHGICKMIFQFQDTGDITWLEIALDYFGEMRGVPIQSVILEVAKHFEEGAKKYGENNWQKGIPVNSYIDSAIRHYLKWMRGDQDEPHDRAFCWNIICAIWTCRHMPELNPYKKEVTSGAAIEALQQAGERLGNDLIESMRNAREGENKDAFFRGNT